MRTLGIGGGSARAKPAHDPSQGDADQPISRVVGIALPLLLFLAAEFLLIGAHVLHGGLYTDDWPIAAIQRQSGFSGLFENLLAGNHDRPLGALYLSLTSAVSGTNPHLHALWGMLTLLFAAGSLYLLLRRLSVGRWQAGSVVLLFLAFPYSDSASLWYAASHSYLAIALAALGVTVALDSLARNGRAAAAQHCLALALFAASVLTYQVAALIICLTLLLYLPRCPRRIALVRWGIDVLVVAFALGLPRLITGSAGSTADPIIPLADQLHHARLMADQSFSLLTLAIVPFGAPHRDVVLPVAFLATCAGVALMLSTGNEPALHHQVRRWLWLLLGGGLVVAAAYAVYIPAPTALYQPLAKGSDNRVNAAASVGYAMVVFALAMLAGASLIRVLRRSARWSPYVGLALTAAVFVGYARRTRHDVDAWNRAGVIQRHELAQLSGVGRPPQGWTIYTFGGTGLTAPSVYAFRVTWDLNGAVELLWNDPTLHAYPIFAGTSMTCTPTEVVPVGGANGDGIAQAAVYGHALFVDFHNGRRQVIRGALSCARAAAAFTPGPVEG